MCGIAGFVTARRLPLAETVQRMAARLLHRGPDGHGIWCDAEAGLALGHRRLSIVDLSASGRQPMTSACGRYVLALNGEIYNYEEIRRRLAAENEAPAWRGRSDTEVLLEAIRAWGLEHALNQAVGMFAFSLWDKRERLLHLARDRFGEKPLFYGNPGGDFVFASELKALAAFPGVQLEVDRAALVSMMQFGYVPSPASIYCGIRKLEAGCTLEVRIDRGGAFEARKPSRYWSLAGDDQLRRREELARLDDATLASELERLLCRAVEQQRLADVPLGAFLSGGVDSSLIVALMQSRSSRPVRSFTIGFREEGYDEAPFAREVARHLGTDHTELYVSAHEAAAIIPQLPEIFDEPFADSSQIPTFLVARMTREHVTVALSGDGGDELFGGYPRYRFGQSLWKSISAIPKWGRHGIAAAATAGSEQAWDRLFHAGLPARLKQSINGYRLHRFAKLLDSSTFCDMYVRLLSQWHPDECLVIHGNPAPVPAAPWACEQETSALNRMRCFDLLQYLPDDILVKVDRAAMSVGLETRAPLLDYRIAEFAWSLPEGALLRDAHGKWLLRQVLDRYVPRHLIERPKAGFAMPVAEWLRADLRDWAEDLLDERRLREQGYLSSAPIRRMWAEHLARTHNHQSRLWNVLMFQAWLVSIRTPSASSDATLEQAA